MIAAVPAVLVVGTLPVACSAAQHPAALAELAPGERLRALQLDGKRREDYLLGRAALRRALGPSCDTSAIAMPHRRLSLTHGGGIAVAAASASDDAIGVGIDWEPRRAMNPAAVRFFLSEREEAAIAGAPDAALRLWTVKEALYKATPDNAGLSLRMFALADPAADSGEAWLAGRRDVGFRYTTWRGAGGFLSAALAFAAPAIRRAAS
jgi:4'-phosphopantetheinyl transferase EntD